MEIKRTSTYCYIISGKKINVYTQCGTVVDRDCNIVKRKKPEHIRAALHIFLKNNTKVRFSMRDSSICRLLNRNKNKLTAIWGDVPIGETILIK